MTPLEQFLAARRRAETRLPHEPSEELAFPEKSRSEVRICLAIFGFACAYLWLFRDYVTFEVDEGIVLQGAARILQGQVLYRDFFSFLTPGSFYWMALLFKIFGSSMLVAHSTLVAYGAVYSVLTYLLARRVCSCGASLLVAYLLLVSTLPYRFFACHNWDSTLWGLLAVYFAVLLLQTGRAWWAGAAGTFTAWCFLVEQSKGACLALGLLLAFALIAWARREAPFCSRATWMAAAGGFLWPFLAVAGYWVRVGAFREMIEDWVWPLYHYTAANRLPYGTVFSSYDKWAKVFENPPWLTRFVAAFIVSPCYLIALLPLAALAVFALSARGFLRRGKEEAETSNYYILVSAAACGLVLSAVVAGHADVSHLIFVGPLLFCVLAWILQGSRTVRWIPGAGRSALALYMFIAFTLLGMVFLREPLGPVSHLQTRRGELKAEHARIVVSYLLEHSRPGEHVLVYPYSPLLYFLTDTYNPTRFDYLQPGLHTREQFGESIRAVERDRTPLVLYDSAFFANITQVWPSTPPAALAEEPLERLLVSSYVPCAVLSKAEARFVAFFRKDIGCSSKPGALLNLD